MIFIVLILANPYMPAVFNNVGFVYLIIAFIDAESLVTMLPWYLVSLAAGSLILNLPCGVFISLYVKNLTKKAIASAKKAESTK